MESLRQSYVLHIRIAAPADDEPAVAALDSVSQETPQEAPQETPKETPQERFYCSLQAIASEEMHYFASLEETVVFLRNNALAFRYKPT